MFGSRYADRAIALPASKELPPPIAITPSQLLLLNISQPRRHSISVGFGENSENRKELRLSSFRFLIICFINPHLDVSESDTINGLEMPKDIAILESCSIFPGP